MANLGKSRQAREGNTEPLSPAKKQQTRKTFYAFTLPNYDKDNLEEAFRHSLHGITNKYLYGYEICPTTKTPHLQGFFALKKAARITELKKLIVGNPHLEPCYAAEINNINYCSKDGNVVSYGFPKPINIITDLRPWQLQIESWLLQEPDPRKLYWIYETEGNVGKSVFTKYLVVKHKALFCDGGKKSDIINLVFNNDMDACNIIVWDIPRCNLGNVSYSAIESIKNGLVCNTKYETGTKVFNPPHVIVFANSEPSILENLSMDRWQIFTIKDNALEEAVCTSLL